MSNLECFCGEEYELIAVSRDVEMKHDGRLVEVHVANMPAWRCASCDLIEYDSNAGIYYDAALRKKLGLLTPEDCRSQRKTLQLTQSQLAEMTGIAAATLSKIEKGRVVHSKATDNHLRDFFKLAKLERAGVPTDVAEMVHEICVESFWHQEHIWTAFQAEFAPMNVSVVSRATADRPRVESEVTDRDGCGEYPDDDPTSPLGDGYAMAA